MSNNNDMEAFLTGVVNNKEYYLNLFEYIKKFIYLNVKDLPSIKKITEFRNDYNYGKHQVKLEYLIHNDIEHGVINNTFEEKNGYLNVETNITLFRDEKIFRQISFYSSFYDENEKRYFEIYDEYGEKYFKKEISDEKEEIKTK